MYLDHNATTPLDPRVAERMRPFFAEAFGNPASREHAYGWDAAEAVELAREQVAELIGATAREIVFTSGTTEGVNLALKGLAANVGGVVAVATEHAAVLETCRQLERTRGLATEVLGVDGRGQVDGSALTAAVGRSQRGLAAVAVANAETGAVAPIADISRLVHQVGGVVFTDMAQAAGKLPIDMNALGVDLAAFSAHKMYGPKGVGALYLRGGTSAWSLEPLIVGGGQESGLRGGTLNVPGIVGFGEACRIARLEMAGDTSRISELRDHLETALVNAIPDVQINGDRESRLPNTTNLCFRGVDGRALIRQMHDVAVSTQSACSTGSNRASHVLTAMGLTDDDAYASIRFSLGRSTTRAEIDATIAKVIAAVTQLRTR